MPTTLCTARRSSCTIRPMTSWDAHVAVQWAAAEGWNPGHNDADCFYQTDPEGFFVAEIDGQAVGSISAMAYDDQFGFIGLYIVQPSFRGGGVGPALGKAALGYLGTRNIGLDGVAGKQANYECFGFRTAHRNIRFEGRNLGQAGGQAPRAGAVLPLSDFPFEEVLRYDSRFFPVPRERFLHGWLNQRDGLALGITEGQRLTGYGVLRPCQVGYKIGPLFADGPDQAEKLFRTLTADLDQEPVYLDVPEVNAEALAMAARFDMTEVFQTVRMYSGQAPRLPHNHIYGITTFELG